MAERTDLVTMKGQKLTLLGSKVRTGEKAPDFEVVANDLSTVKFSSFSLISLLVKGIFGKMLRPLRWKLDIKIC